jgi:hypothetical protein
MLEDGGMLVQPSMTGRRPGYRSAQAQENRSKGRTSASKSTGPSFSDQGSGDDNRQTYSAIQTQTGKVKGGGAPIIGSGGETIGFEDDRPSQKAIDNARKFQEEQNKKKSTAIFSNRSFNPFPIATSILNKISNSRLAKYNNLLQRNNYLRTLPPDQQVAILERLAEEEEIGTTNPMGIDRNIQRGMGTYDYLDPTKVDKGFLGTGIGAGKFVTDIEFGGKDAKDVINEVTDGGYDDYLNRNKTDDTGGDSDPVEQDPCKGPNPPAYCFIGENVTEETDPTNIFAKAGITPRIAGSLFAADGGRIGAAEGGIMELARQEMFLGGIAKGLKKITKGATRAIKKIAKSPIGKAALLYAGGSFLGGLKTFGGAGFGQGNFFSNLKSGQGIGNLARFAKDKLLGTVAYDDVDGTRTGGILEFLKDNPYLAIGGASVLAGAMTPKKDDNQFDLASYYAKNQLTPSQSVRGVGSEMDFYDYNIPLAEGGMPSKEPVAKETMPLLDMDGKEMDLRAEGGFVPIGRMEKADDVPARLSKNEFVFTADAVRNAGDGDVDKGAEVMYNMMKNLESGGDVSEESQGLKGAREMFQTSKRLEEVL